MANAILTIDGLTLRASGTLVLKDVAFALPPTGITALMGPVGAGKSALDRWLSGKADPAGLLADIRRADYFMAPLSRRNRPPLLAQKQGLGFQQMMQVLNVMLADNPPLICLDEPTFGLSPDEASRMMERLAVVARSRALLVVSHDHREMREHARQVLLLAEGQMQEYTPSDVFFSAPLSEAGRHFLGTGWAGLPGVGRATLPLGQPFGPVPEELGLRSVACGGRLRAVLGDRIFVHDLQRTQGMSRSDAAALTGAGIRTVAIFSPQSASEALALLAYGLTSLKLPLPSPTDALPALRARCSTLQEALASQGPLVFLRRPEDRQVGFTVALFLVSLGIRADLAAEMAAEIDGAEQPDPAAESRLLDLELSLTLERDSPDPNGFAAPPRETARPDRQAHTRRGTSG